jgi:hypothetical protein
MKAALSALVALLFVVNAARAAVFIARSAPISLSSLVEHL